MSGDQLDLDAIEDHAHKTADQGSGSDPHTVLALVAEVRRLRAAVQFKQGIIEDLSATVERLEWER